jgi:Gas vesicle synthesis protein GvpL/GvpF
MASGCYVYAIVTRETCIPADLVGHGGARLFKIPCGELAAVTSALNETGLVEPSAEHVLHHETVVEAVCQAGAALPVRFGTVLANADAVTAALVERQSILTADLARLGDKVEMGLTVLWEPPLVQEEPVQEGPSDSEPIDPRGPGARYLQARLRRRHSEAAIRSKAKELARNLDEALGPETLDRRWTILPTPRMAARAAYLLDPSQVRRFRETFDETRRVHPELRFLLSGPWPPYSFVTPTRIGEQRTDGRGGPVAAARTPSSSPRGGSRAAIDQPIDHADKNHPQGGM